ncbi:FAD-binding oxidoreductase [Thalassospiraceae bacterium LMO-JJ14]|nr:FAD-binding oxidoreductase [Thalassospiraceae bacterium LMO-JJ14]
MSTGLSGDVVACRVREVEAASPEVRIIRLEPDDAELFDWRAGQYASFRIGDLEPRDYSIANAPGAGVIELHIRRSGAGGVSDYICDELKSGDPVDVQGAFGGAYYRARHDGPLLAVAGGTGLAPMKAIVEDALAGGFRKDVHLYFGVREESELYLERYFIDLMHTYPNFRFVTVISEPQENSGRRTGFVSDAVAADFQLLYGHQCYLAGPPVMVDACAHMLKLKSVPRHDIFADAFYSEAEMQARGAPRPDWD